MESKTKKLLNEQEVHQEYGLGLDYLRSARANYSDDRKVEPGPPFMKAGRSVFYPRAGLDQWIKERTIDPKRDFAGRRVARKA